MVWIKSICLLTIALLVIVNGDPLPSSKSLKRAEKKMTRHDHDRNCQYTKGSWSECNLSTNTKTRTLSLKKGSDETGCEKTKTTVKKCKKICKYDKGTWSACNENNEMTRTDVLRTPITNPSCEKNKMVTKTCKNKVRSGKGQKRKQKEEQQQIKGRSKQQK